MIPGGIGYEVLVFDGESLRDIAKLPADVRIIRALTDPAMRHYGTALGDDWFVGGALRPVYILIAHRYSVRVLPGCVYQFTPLNEFLERYKELAVKEGEPLEPINLSFWHSREAWHRGADGVAREYVWADEVGWLLK